MTAVDTHPAAEAETYEHYAAEVPANLVKLHARNLDFFYGKHQALHSVNLPVIEKGVTAMIGPSGCGKSTLLRAMNRIRALPWPAGRGRGHARRAEHSRP